MKVVAVDPDPIELVRLSESIRKTYSPGTSVECFRDPLFVYQYAASNKIDVLYAVAGMNRLSGIDIAKTLRKLYPEIRTVYIWDNDDYRKDAIGMQNDGYIIKPVTPEKLKDDFSAHSRSVADSR